MREFNLQWDAHGHDLLIRHRHDVEKAPGEVIIEVGSERGEGSTKALATLALELKKHFITIDMNPDISNSAARLVSGISPNFESICGPAEEVLPAIKGRICLAYLDGYDTMPPGADLPQDLKEPYRRVLGGWSLGAAWRMHLDCSRVLEQRISPGGLISFDDVWKLGSDWALRSKGYTAVPYLLQKGYVELDYMEGAILLRRD